MMKTTLVLLTLLSVSSLASAGLTVQSFSCNSQSGTIVVETGGTLNCQATIKNTGNNAANVSSISLLTDGSWAEETSYTGLGHSTSVNGGSTTTATFGNIKPTTAGVHNFNYVKIDSVTDNYPASSIINVISIKNIVSTSPANATAGENFTVSVSVTAGGNINLALTINVTNCELATGEITTRNLGTVSDNTVKSASWRITQGANSDCAYNVAAAATGGALTVSRASTGSVASTAADGAINVTRLNTTLDTTADTTATVNASAVNTTLTIETSSGVAGATLELSSHDGNPTGTNFALASVGRYLNITASANLSGNLSWVLINLTYTTTELTAANINESVLWIYWYNNTSSAWTPLNESGKSGRDNTTAPRSVWANTTHFSTFTIGGSSLSQSASYALQGGWNLISIPLTA